MAGHRRLVYLIILLLLAGVPAPATASDAAGARVFVIQHRTHPDLAQSYDALYREVRALVQAQKPGFSRTRPNIVVFPAYTGLISMATGPRFASVRDLLKGQEPYAATEPGEHRPGFKAAAAALGAGYGSQAAYYAARFPGTPPQRAALLASTDTVVRSFYNAFERVARELNGPAPLGCGVGPQRCEVYIVAGAILPDFERVDFGNDPSALFLVDPEILVNGDPVLEHGPLTYVIQPVEWAYRARSADPRTSAFMWGPGGSLVGRSSRSNPGDLETLLGVAPGGADLVQPLAVPGTQLRLGVAIGGDVRARSATACRPSVDALGGSSMPGHVTCLSDRGANVLVHLGATGSRWAENGSRGWRPTAATTDDWGAVTDPSLGFRFGITSYLVGNLADLVFDGQSAVWADGYAGDGLSRVGSLEVHEGDESHAAGPKAEAVAMAPWVVPDGPRDSLRAVSARLAPGSGDPIEGRYVQTSLCVDIDLSAGATPCP
ncbi:MAG TPA: hypothetical protein VM840_01540 [Actinomycetota bacterium]|nr:hypothetical protein [Actinomycetota bacterium]